MSFSEMIIFLILSFFSILIAFAVHELSHGIMAYKLGDPTPKYEGRLTLNPLKHLDPVGAVVLLVSLFMSGGKIVLGWGKPVRFNSMAFRNPVVDGGLVAFAGPLANFILLCVAGIPVRLGLVPIPILEDAMAILAGVNAALFVFNLLPFPPLDGWKILQVFLPSSLAYKMQALEIKAGNAPVYVLMACIWFFGSYIIAPPYMFLMNTLVGRLPIQ